MASEAAEPLFPGSVPDGGAALQHVSWRRLIRLSSGLERVETFLAHAGLERAPWLAVGFAGGISLWFSFANRWQWLTALALLLSVALGAGAFVAAHGRFSYLRQAVMAMAIVAAAGLAVVWTKSALVGEAAIARPMVQTVTARVLNRIEQPAEDRVRLLLALRDGQTGRAMRVRVNLPLAQDNPAIAPGSLLQLKLRLMPPAPPMLPGGYDFARSAWFSGLAATGSVLGPVRVLRRGTDGSWLAKTKAGLSRHVRERLDGTPGAIAAAFASGDRGAIAREDDAAMRDAGLSHLLSISGLHVSAVIAATYFVTIRLAALWPWLALRVRLPLVAAGNGAAAGVFYTLLTGSEVPTVRSCIGAILVLAALALGREPLSLRMLAVAAFLVMLIWPEAVVGPSFQMSFAAVIAIIALHGSAPVRAFLAPREERWLVRALRNLAMLLLTGIVIELALMPIGLFHFHRAGVYGALANVVAIPLTTFVTMPLIALALLLDIAGAGGPAWWLVGKSLEAMLAIAHWTAARPGAVTVMPALGQSTIALFVMGGLWLALWTGKVRLLGLAAVALGAISLLTLRTPDILISGDGHHVGITDAARGELIVLREGRSSYARDTLLEIAGMNGSVRRLADWPGAQCSREFCALDLARHGRIWRLLIARGKDRVPERALAAACDRADIVIGDRWLPRSCKPALLKADRSLLTRSGGLSIHLATGKIRSVARSQGEHGWWREPEPRLYRPAPVAAASAGISSPDQTESTAAATETQ